MVVDSSVWIEVLRDGKLRTKCEAEIAAHKPIRVPTLVIYEVYRKIKQLASEEEALEVVAFLRKYEILDLSGDVALAAADLSVNQKMPMADSIVLAHARILNDVLLTLDNDFAGHASAIVIRTEK